MSALPKENCLTAPDERLGIAALTRQAFEGKDMTEIASRLLIEISKNPGNAGALMDLSVIEQIRGNTQTGLDYQRNALIHKNLYRTGSGEKKRLTLLVLAAPIHMGGNTPVEMLLENANVEIITVFIAPGLPVPETLPPHDLIMIAAPGDTGSVVSIMPGIQPKDYLEEIRNFLDGVTLPVINKAEPIFRLERDLLGETLGETPGVRVPLTARLETGQIRHSLHQGDVPAAGNASFDYPFVIRPVGSHAGFGFEMIRSAEGLEAYLKAYEFPEYFLSELVDYRSQDGQFRKYRIMFVDSEAFPCHMAIGDTWKLWYMNAKMEECTLKRMEEAAFMIQFRETFSDHLAKLDMIASRIGLDYFGIDCAICEDGSLVVFEADNAMIAHDMDPVDIYPYKGPAMRNMFKAFETMLAKRSVAGSTEPQVQSNEPSSGRRWVRIG
ncbi:MAG: hypothetical protein JJ891_04560 [Rhizobiaceae bacterium]|nr:hypothetical protein [Rhizobiaceae bacterium]